MSSSGGGSATIIATPLPLKRHDMSEQELKLSIPLAARTGVAREMQRRDAKRIKLHAMYFDTPSRALARARIALRLRQEGDSWMQTLKMPGADAITRVEINHPRPGPVLDLSVYAGSDVEAALAAIEEPLGLRYETDVQRIVRKVRTSKGTVEIALDSGEIRAGAFALPLHELEFELISGQVAAIFDVARGWHERHGLVLDPRSKSERGDALAALAQDLNYQPVVEAGSSYTSAELKKRAARIAAFWGPRTIKATHLRPTMNAGDALATVTAECLDQVTRNAAILAEVDTHTVYEAGGPDHVHQLRVGVRRLRSAWKLFDGVATLPPDSLQARVRDHFGGFGANRDQDVQKATILPKLQAAGMPELPPLPAQDGDDSATLARSKAFQSVLLDMLEWSVTPQPSVAAVAAMAEAMRPATASAHPDAQSAQGSSDTEGDAAIQTEPTENPAGHIVPTIIPLIPAGDIPALDGVLLDKLQSLHRQIVKRGKRFTSLEIEQKHALRKRVKLLRYSLGFCESLLSNARLRAYRKPLGVVQDILGDFNDLAVAHDGYAARVKEAPAAWFAVGWLAAKQALLVDRAQDAFVDLGRAPEFWKKHS